jgi:hypothetical protein
MNITKEELKELFEQKLTETAQVILEAVEVSTAAPNNSFKRTAN